MRWILTLFGITALILIGCTQSGEAPTEVNSPLSTLPDYVPGQAAFLVSYADW